MKQIYTVKKWIILFMMFMFPVLLIARDAPISTAGSLSTCTGNSFCIPLTVTNFTQVTAISLRLDYDPTYMTYTGYDNVNAGLPGILINQVTVSATLKKILIVWSNVTPLTLTDGSKLLDLCFTPISGTPTLSFNNTAGGGAECEYADENGDPMTDTPTASFYFNSTITINTLPVPTITGPTLPCFNSTGNVYTTENGMTNYIWDVSPGGTVTAGGTTSDNTVTVTWTLAGAQTVSVNYTNGNGCTAASATIYNVTIYPQFVVGSIAANQSICYNTTPAQLTGTAPTGGNTPYSYQWQSSTDNVTFTDITSATNLNYQPAALTQTTYYRLNQTSSSGCGTLTTNTVTITVYPLFIVGSIAANQSICYNITPVQLTGTAPTGGNTPYTYQWQTSTDNVTFTNITGETNLNYQPAALTQTTYYRLNQTSASGCGTLTTNTVTITVYPLFVVGSIAANQTICYNITPAQLTGTAPTGGNTPYTYQWQSSSDNVTFANITGATNLDYQPGSLTQTTYYRLNQTSASGCGTLTTNTVTITVYPQFVVGSIAASQAICYNTTPAQLTGTAPTGGNTPYTYQWQSSTDNVTFTDITGETNLNYQPGALTQTTYYRLNQTSASGCGTLTSNTVTITVYPLFVVGSIAANQTICYNTTPGQLTGTAPTGGNMPYTYQWQSSADNVTFTNITGATNLNYQPGALTQTTYYRLNQTSASGCGTLTTNTVTITVYPQFVVGSIAASQAICYNTTPAQLTGTAPTGGNTPYTYQWQSSADNVTFTNITGATNLNYQPGALTQTTYYRLNQTSTSGCGTLTTNTVTITVNPLPVPTITGPTLCGVGTSGHMYTTETGMTGYSWTISAGGTIDSGQGTNSISVTWNTAGSQSVCVNYINGNGCTAATATCFNVEVITYPNPAGPITGTAVVCQNTNGVAYSVAPIVNATSYEWDLSSLPGASIATGANTNSITVNYSTVAQSGTIRVRGVNSFGTGAWSPLFSVTVNPMPTPTISGPNDICVDMADFYTTEAGFTNYIWTVSAGGTIIWGAGTNQIEIEWNTPGTQTVTVNYTNTYGCTAHTPTSLTVTVNPLPGAAGDITGTSEVCAGSTGIAYSVSTITDAVTYVWLLPAGATFASGQWTNTITVDFSANASSGDILVYGNNLCGNGAFSPPFAVTVDPLPDTAGTISGTASVCQGDMGVSYSVDTIVNATGYTWTVPTGATIASGANTNTITVNFSESASSGVITVLGTNSCGNGQVSPEFTVTVNPKPPTPTITLSYPILTSSAVSGNQWYFNGTVIPGATSQTYEAIESGDYYVIVTVDGCSSDPSNVINVVITGIHEYNGISVLVFPNPTDGNVTVSVQSLKSESFTLQVFNNLGLLIYEVKDFRVDGSVQRTIDLHPAPSGMYNFIVKNKDHYTATKVIIQN